MGASNAGVKGTNRDRRRYLAWLSIDDVLDLWTTTATIRRAPTATHQWIYIYRSLQHARLRRRQNRTVYAVLNRKQNLRSTYCSEANDRHEASRGLFATAELLVLFLVLKRFIQLVQSHGTRWFPGHVLHRAVNNQDVIKKSDTSKRCH